MLASCGARLPSLSTTQHRWVVQLGPSHWPSTIPMSFNVRSLSEGEVERQIEIYLSKSAHERRVIVGLQPKRADVILASFCSKTVKRAVVAGKNAQSRQSVFRWRRTAPFQKVIYMRPESLLSRRAETCRRTSCMAVKQGVSEESGEVRMQPCWCGAYFALLLAAE